MSQLRSMSSGTDVLSMSAKSTRPGTLPHAAAPASYVSAAEAENLIYAEIERLVRISNGALFLLNGFLDQILYDILCKSQSTTLPSLRAAIPLVLKQRLGRAAIKAADEELQDYLEEDELDEIQNTPAVLNPRAEFDADLAWKLTRLRCMVYAKLGDMEEEDEEDHLESDDVREHLDRVREGYRSSARILPPAAIFLTTVLEFLAEQALCIAAQHAKKRNGYGEDPTREQIAGAQPSTAETIFLEEIDMSGIGKEGPLIRLWRSWKGSVRIGGGSMSSRPTTPSIMSPSNPESPVHEWRFPPAPGIGPIQEERSGANTPANIPLPITENDVEEIEVPGLASLDKTEGQDPRPGLRERKSLSKLILPGQLPVARSLVQSAERPQTTRQRSHSAPASPPATSSKILEPQWKTLSPKDAEHQVGTTKEVEPEEDGDTQEQDSKPQEHDEQERSIPRSTAIGATVATIAGALSVEAARAVRREQSTPDLVSPVSPISAPVSAVEPGASIHTANDFERMHVPLRASTGIIEATENEAQEHPTEPETPALDLNQNQADPPDHEQSNPRDSGFGVGVAENEIIQHYQENAVDEAMPGDDEPDTQADAFAPSTRSSNVGYATIFQTPDTNAGYSSSNSTRTSGQGIARTTDHATTPNRLSTVGLASTSAWPAVIPKRRSSLEQQRADQAQSDVRFPQHLPQSQPSGGHEHVLEQPVPRFATSAYAAQVGRSRSGSANQPRPSTSGSASARRQHIRLRSDAEEAWQREDLDRAKKSLDLLIDSDETLHYTLTPASANVGARTKAKSQTQDLADFFRETAPPGQEVRPKSSRSAKEGLNGLRANPPTPLANRTNAPFVQNSMASPTRPKNRVGEPREARMVRNNTRDLADYARSTGPENPAQLPKALGTRPPTAPSPKTDLSLREKALGEDSRPSTSKPTNRLKYQARDAKVPRTADSSDLIDFIREGPPRAPGEHRIDRHVAPFRTTMDSDDLNALAPPPELDSKGRNSDGSAQESNVTVKSMPSSMNSRTGLLDSMNRAAGKPMNGASAVPKQPVIPETDGMPQRTRRRVRDPYAIDFSDEEDEMEEFQAPQKRRTDEESLVDFLRNTAPPPGMTTQPILAAIPSPTQPDTASMIKRTGSSSKLKDFLPGGGSSHKGISSTNGNGVSSAGRPTNTAREESPHLTQTGSKLDRYKPTSPTHAAHVDRNRTQNKSRVQPRDAATGINSSNTADLAAYLKNSGPPPGMNDKPVQKFNTSLQKDQAGFMKFFQRRGSVRK